MLIRPTIENIEHDDFEIIPLDDSDDKVIKTIPVRLFIEFKSHDVRGFNVIYRMKNLVTTSDLFVKLSDENFESHILFPFRQSERLIIFNANIDRRTGAIQFSLTYDNKIFLVIIGTFDGQILVKRGLDSKAIPQWTNEDIDDIVDCINQYIKSDNIVYYDDLSKISKTHLKFTGYKGRMTVGNFAELAGNCKNYTMNYRINHVILENSIPVNEKYHFVIDWMDSKKIVHPVKAIFSTNDKFFNPSGKNPGYSWVMTEDTLLKHFDPYKNYKILTGRNYYSLQLFEIVQGETTFQLRENHVLDIWFTMDGLYGELHKLSKGTHLTGNDVLTLYLLFDNLFRVKTTFINDVSAIHDERKTISIPLRLISALTIGNTWYQSKIPGLSLFNTSQFKTVANGDISQDSFARSRALKELQDFPVYKWYSILPSEDKQKLCEIYNRNIKKVFPEFNADTRYRTRSSTSLVDLFDKKFTIKKFAEIIYNYSKEQKCVTYDLNMLTYLLVGQVDGLERVTNLTGSDAWVKTRANQLLFGSTFWVKSCDNSTSVFKDQIKNVF